MRSRRRPSPSGGHLPAGSQLSPFPGSVPGEEEEDLHICLREELCGLLIIEGAQNH